MEAGSVLTSTQKLVKHNSTEATRRRCAVRFLPPRPGLTHPCTFSAFPCTQTSICAAGFPVIPNRGDFGSNQKC